MKNSKDPFGSKTDEARTVLSTRCVVVALIAFIAVFGAALAFHYLRLSGRHWVMDCNDQEWRDATPKLITEIKRRIVKRALLMSMATTTHSCSKSS
ncbi:MAG: hypothetical protein WA366_04680 [Pseudolabrys sp.]|jgi:hypothetical protein